MYIVLIFVFATDSATASILLKRIKKYRNILGMIEYFYFRLQNLLSPHPGTSRRRGLLGSPDHLP
jgi:hypothetical protein